MHPRLFVCTLLIAASFSSLARAEWGFELENSGIHLDYGHNPVPTKGTVLFPTTATPTTLDQLFTGTPWPWKEDWVLTVDEQVGTNNRDLEFVSRALPLKSGLLNDKRVCNAFKTLKTKAFGPLNAARTSPPAGTFTVTLHKDSSHSSTFNLKAVSNKDSWSPQITLSLPMGTAAPGSHSALWEFLKGLVTTNIVDSAFIFGSNDIFLHTKNVIDAIHKATFRISDAEKAFVAVIASYWYSGACIQKARPTYFRLFPGYPKGVASFILMRTSLAAIYHHLGPNKKTPQQLAQIVIDLGQLIRDTTSTPAAQGVAGGCVKNQCDVAADPSTVHGIHHDPASVFFSVCSHNAVAGTWAVKPEANFAPTLDEFFTALGNGYDVLSNHGYDAVHHPAHPTDVFESMGKIQTLDGSHQDMVRFELRAITAGVGFLSKDDTTAQSTLLSRIWSVYKAGQTALKGKPVAFAKTILPAKCFQ